MEQTKPGWKTTEFWLTVVANIVIVIGALKDVIPANVATIAITILSAVYTLLRSILKNPDIADITTLIKK
jgi:uncharacterized MnhB-related membrane protein